MATYGVVEYDLKRLAQMLCFEVDDIRPENYITAEDRKALREWAEKLPQTSIQHRLVLVWQKLRQLRPNFHECLWATYIGWGQVGGDGSFHMDEWEACKEGMYLPSECQLQCAELATGLPYNWLLIGDSLWLRECEL